MSLPLSRNTTYTNPSQVKSVDLNDIQDQIIALHTTVVPRVLPIWQYFPRSAFWTNPNPTLAEWTSTAQSDSLVISFDVTIGKRLRSAKVRCLWQNGVDPHEFKLYQRTQGGSHTLLDTFYPAATSGSTQDAVSAAVDHVYVAGSTYYIVCTTSSDAVAADCHIGATTINEDHSP